MAERKSYTAEKRLEILEKFKLYQGTLKQFCIEHGVSKTSFYEWCKKLTPSEHTTSPAFIPVQLNTIVDSKLSSTGEPCWKALFPNGVVLCIPLTNDTTFIHTMIQSLKGGY